MSSSEEIREVYEGDIARQTRVVFNRQGIKPFVEDDLPAQDIYPRMGELTEIWGMTERAELNAPASSEAIKGSR